MGTHAIYRIWVGLDNNLIRLEDDAQSKFLEKIEVPFGESIEGEHFRKIYMHGQAVGFGVVISELGWTDELERDNYFDLKVAEIALQTLKNVNVIFAKHGVDVSPKIYHHIDLGG